MASSNLSKRLKPSLCLGKDIHEYRHAVTESVNLSKEGDMNPTSESTKLEGVGGFREYIGVGKLKNKKAIITGGE